MLRLSFIILFTISLYAQSPHGEHFNIDCGECHTTTGWKIIPSEMKYNHDVTSFSLTGQHKSVDCRQCHSVLNFSDTKSECIDCHKDIHQNTVGQDCARCHQTSSWLITNIIQLHENERFPLLGKHKSARCEDCHKDFNDLRFSSLNVTCFDCHSKEYYSAKTPDHVMTGFSTECSECHSAAGLAWRANNINHDFFPLTGKHNIANCFDCHQGNTFAGLSKQCYSCHKNNFETAVNPDHKQAGFSIECESCHNINGWSPASFNHSLTQFPLTGAHLEVQCSACHSSGYNNISTQCYSCHTDEYKNSIDPNHTAAGIPTECESCHNTNSWEPATFDHDQKYFPIYSGEHRGKWDNCSSCHTQQNNFAVFSCIDCHEHNKTETDDKHKEVQGYVYASRDCYICHPNGSSEGGVNHSLTNFPLTGAHLTVNCSDCHQAGYAGTPMNCSECHQNDFSNAVNPNHVNAGISNKCEECHTTTSWNTTTFQHISTGFELTGAHKPIQCSSCHEGTTTGLTGTCISCHQAKYDTAPDHKTQNYPQNCEMCHNTTIWTQTDFNHASTDFPLTGAHQNTNCSNCHQGGYTNTPINCVDCHNQDFQSTVNPSHKTLALSTDCISCHTTTAGWKPASFTIHNTFYELLGAHASSLNDCAGCHKGNYTNTPNTCYGCHASDFNNVIDPSHSAAGFSTDCIPCHSQTAWKPATFDHDGQYFPIYSGKHRGKWDKCSECHTHQNNFAVFSCIDCHEHNKTETDDDHSEVQGYAYISTACYDCHPNGDEGKMKGLMR